MTPAYWADMKIVDERLKRLERNFEEISQLLRGLSTDIKAITNGGNKSGEQEKSDKSSQGQKSI